MELSWSEEKSPWSIEPNGRRGELDIIVDLLLNSMQTVRSTHILYKTNLGYNQMKKYLVVLIRLGLIEQTEMPFRGFRITQKGRAFIDLLSPEQERQNKTHGIQNVKLDELSRIALGRGKDSL